MNFSTSPTVIRAGAGSFVDDAFQRESHDEAAVSSALVGNRRTRSRIVLHRREGGGQQIIISNREIFP